MEAAKDLKEDHYITIRKADKTALYVLMEATEYLNQIDSILADEAKFARIRKDPIGTLKKRLSKLINKNNTTCTSVKFTSHR